MEKTHAIRNERLLYCFTFFHMFLVFIPVIIPYFLSLGLSMEDIFLIQAIFGVTMAIFEVPSGYIGDIWGRKAVLSLGCFFSGIGFTLLSWASDFWSLVVYEIVLAIGASFISGADLSLLYDSIDSQTKKLKAVSRFQSLHLLGEATASIVCSGAMVFGFGTVIKIQIVTGWIPFLISIFIKETPVEKLNEGSHFKNLKFVFNEIFLVKALNRLLFINLTVWSISTFCAVWILQKVWLDNGASETDLGYLWGLMHILAALTAFLTPKIERTIGRLNSIKLMGIIIVGTYITMGLFEGIIVIVLSSGFYVGRGIQMVTLKESFNSVIESKYRNTANSLSSLFFRLTFFILGPFIGYIIDVKGFDYALFCLGGLFAFCFLFVLIPFVKFMKQASD